MTYLHGMTHIAQIYLRSGGGYNANPETALWLCHVQPLEEMTPVDVDGRTNTDIAYGEPHPAMLTSNAGSKLVVYLLTTLGGVGPLFGTYYVQTINPHTRPGFGPHSIRVYLRQTE